MTLAQATDYRMPAKLNLSDAAIPATAFGLMGGILALWAMAPADVAMFGTIAVLWSLRIAFEVSEWIRSSDR
jgi:hypothetical protein